MRSAFRPSTNASVESDAGATCPHDVERRSRDVTGERAGYDCSAPMTGSRRFSQAISEGDGISLLADVDDPDSARSAELEGAEGIVVRSDVAAVRAATDLPILWCTGEPLERVREAGVDACLVVLERLADDDGRLEQLYAHALELGLDCVVEVRDEDELQLALDRVDPEVFLLSARGTSADGLEHVLGLLPDVPAGKLAIAELDVRDASEVAELERAGVDGVVVPGAAVAELARAAPHEV